jgi:hypothetical protein
MEKTRKQKLEVCMRGSEEEEKNTHKKGKVLTHVPKTK